MEKKKFDFIMPFTKISCEYNNRPKYEKQNSVTLKRVSSGPWGRENFLNKIKA